MQICENLYLLLIIFKIQRQFRNHFVHMPQQTFLPIGIAKQTHYIVPVLEYVRVPFPGTYDMVGEMVIEIDDASCHLLSLVNRHTGIVGRLQVIVILNQCSNPFCHLRPFQQDFYIWI